MKYISNTPPEQKEMLKAIDAEEISSLFDIIPEDVRLNRPLQLPEGMSEMEILELMKDKAEENVDLEAIDSYLGAGAYDHYQPAIIDHLVLRQEFYTAYTPYQAELSQGTLQAMYEYQSMIAHLTDMGIANASLLDGGSAVGEGVLMAARHTGKDRIIMFETIHPAYRQVARTYGRPQGIEFDILSYQQGGTANVEDLAQKIDENTAAVMVQYPNFYGAIEDMKQLAEIVTESEAQLIVVANPIALGLLTPPGKFAADIVVGEGQPLGNTINYGGPYLGYMAIRDDRRLVRSMPGRLAGKTVDDDGNTGFVMTLQTRQQHIRRERATSNICTNENLNAVMAAIYLATLGKQGLQEVAEHCYQKTHYLKNKLDKVSGVQVVNGDNHFHELWLKFDKSVEEIERGMIKQGILPGVNLSQFGEVSGLLVNVTEKKYKDDLDKYTEALEVIL